MRILVTGVAGFIGSHLVERLAHAGHDVEGVDGFTDYYDPALKELNAADVEAAGVRIMRSDLAEADLAPLVQGAEVVFHCAAQPGISSDVPLEAYVRNNLTATHRLLEACKGETRLRCFVNVATSSVYGAHATDDEETPPKPTSYYGVTKLAAEQLALAYHREGKVPACSLRLFSVYGPRERPEKLYPKLIRSILDDTEFTLYEGSDKHTRSYTYVGDIVAGFMAVLNHLDACVGEIFNMGSDREISTGDGIRIVEDILGRQARKVILARRPGDQLRTCADIGKARRMLDYDPQVPAEEGLRAEVNWYKDRAWRKDAE